VCFQGRVLRLKEVLAVADRSPCPRQGKRGIKCDRLRVELSHRLPIFGRRQEWWLQCFSILLKLESSEIKHVGLWIVRRFHSETCLFFRIRSEEHTSELQS